MLPRGLAPAWVMPKAKFDLDFANNRYWGCEITYDPYYLNTAFASYILEKGVGYSPSYLQDGNGIVRQIPVGVARVMPGLGIYCDGSTSFYALWTRDFTNSVWVKLAMTAAKNQTGADLTANGGCLLTAIANNATVLQVITQSSYSCLASCYVKRISGSGTVSMTVDGGITYTDVTSQLTANSYTRIAAGIQTVTNPNVGFKLGTSGDSIAVDFYQLEQASGETTTPTSIFVINGSPDFRYNSFPCFYSPNGGNQVCAGQRFCSEIFFSGKPLSIFASYTGNVLSGFPGGLLIGSDGTGPVGIVGGGANGIGANFAGASTSNVGNVSSPNKATMRSNGLGAAVCLNGGTIATYNGGGSTPASPPSVSQSVWTHGSIGTNGSSTQGYNMNGYISRLTFWDSEITDGQMVQYTQ